MIIGDEVNDIATIKHEYGHTVQFKEMGPDRFLRKVAIPSISWNILSRMDKLPYDYYSSPWEYQADIYGGVTGRSYEQWADKINGQYSNLIRILP